MAQKVYVGLSGGVDSSVSAALLKQQGYDVHGIFMKNWSKPIGRFECPWRDDYLDAKRVAAALNIPFELVDFENEYFDRVVSYMLEAFRHGITPNPDVMCNQEIKFKLFLEVCQDKGADFIATGHYAKTEAGHLLRAVDEGKDQTYFLYRVSREALQKTLFPLGEYKKSDVRILAQTFSLPTAHKKESMGICFVGKVGIKDFLKEYVGEQLPGQIINQHGAVVGEHDGAIFYTIGQRSGLGVGGGLPYYVYGKDIAKNEVYVTNNLADPSLWRTKVVLSNVHWINQPSSTTTLYARNRHRAELVPVKQFQRLPTGEIELHFAEPVRALTPGQSTVLYSDTECLGGGIVAVSR